MFLSDSAKTRLPELARQFHLLYNRVSHDAGRCPQKVHLFTHVMKWQVPEIGLNPRGYWTNGDEELVGTMVEVSRSCHP